MSHRVLCQTVCLPAFSTPLTNVSLGDCDKLPRSSFRHEGLAYPGAGCYWQIQSSSCSGLCLYWREFSNKAHVAFLISRKSGGEGVCKGHTSWLILDYFEKGHLSSQAVVLSQSWPSLCVIYQSWPSLAQRHTSTSFLSIGVDPKSTP